MAEIGEESLAGSDGVRIEGMEGGNGYREEEEKAGEREELMTSKQQDVSPHSGSLTFSVDCTFSLL